MTGQALALGVDRPQAQSGLGQPLNLLFPVRLSPGETLSADCVQAEVFSGENRIAASQLRIQLEGASEASVRGLRLRSAVAIDEPIINVNLSVGCPARLVRQYSALMDPPNAQNQASSEEASAPSPRNYSPAMRAALASAGAQPAALLGEPLQSSTAVAPSKPGPAQPKSKKLASGSQTAEPSMALASAAPASAAEPKVVKPKSKQKAKADEAQALKPSSKPASTPRLRLDAPEDLPVALATAESAAPGQLLSDAEALQRLQKLEEGLSKLRRDKQGTEARVLALRSELASQGEAGPWSALNLGLIGAALGLAGLSAYLWLSRQRERSLREAAWWRESSASGEGAGEAPAPSGQPQASVLPPLAVTAAAASASTRAAGGPFPDEQTIVLPHIFEAEASPDLAPGGPLQQGDEGQVQDMFSLGRGLSAAAGQTEAGPPAVVSEARPSGFGGLEPLSVQLVEEAEDPGLEWPGAQTPAPAPSPAPAAARSTALDKHGDAAHVSVEELIDLEQQVDFFLVLGQTEAAVELLLVHIHTETASALPYLKLMEIYQRQGNMQGFNDVADRFARRFHGLPPTWGQDMRRGRHLEAYTEVMSLLQLGWSNSHGSMATVQSLLAKGDEQSIGFELPAYLDLLLLYSVARDLSEHEVRSESVDLFLPLDAPEQGEAGMDLMATMVWQAPDQAPSADAGVDILLDEAPLIRKV
ncbi:hypothetical protein DBR47_20910 [Paucibacter sp. KBW04]|nr:hypothetical protein DBR47_20910 [Paucibacter sp. KBW04]